MINFCKDKRFYVKLFVVFSITTIILSMTQAIASKVNIDPPIVTTQLSICKDESARECAIIKYDKEKGSFVIENKVGGNIDMKLTGNLTVSEGINVSEVVTFKKDNSTFLNNAIFNRGASFSSSATFNANAYFNKETSFSSSATFHNNTYLKGKVTIGTEDKAYFDTSGYLWLRYLGDAWYRLSINNIDVYKNHFNTWESAQWWANK